MVRPRLQGDSGVSDIDELRAVGGLRDDAPFDFTPKRPSGLLDYLVSGELGGVREVLPRSAGALDLVFALLSAPRGTVFALPEAILSVE